MDTLQEAPKTFNSSLAVAAQSKFCKDNKHPNFTYGDPFCIRCRKNIYEPVTRTQGDQTYAIGILVESTGSRCVTGCPHCNVSYCD